MNTELYHQMEAVDEPCCCCATGAQMDITVYLTLDTPTDLDECLTMLEQIAEKHPALECSVIIREA